MAQHATSPHSWIADRLGGPQQKFKEFASAVYARADTLDRKTKELIAVAASSVGRCPHCTRSHMEAALEAGASREQVAEALTVLWVIGGSVQIVWDEEGFEEHLGAAARV